MISEDNSIKFFYTMTKCALVGIFHEGIINSDVTFTKSNFYGKNGKNSTHFEPTFLTIDLLYKKLLFPVTIGNNPKVFKKWKHFNIFS